MFAITKPHPDDSQGWHRRRMHIRNNDGTVRTFKSQAAAYKWIKKQGDSHFEFDFEVFPWHNLEGQMT